MKNVAYKTNNERLPIVDIRKELPNLRMIFLSLSIAYCFDEFWRKKGEGEKTQTIETTKKKIIITRRLGFKSLIFPKYPKW